MVDKLSETQVKFLSYLVGLLLTFLTIATVAIAVDVQRFKEEMPEIYVRLERYQSDEYQRSRAMQRIETKLDKLIMQRNKNNK